MWRSEVFACDGRDDKTDCMCRQTGVDAIMTYLVQKSVGAQVTERQRVSTSAAEETDLQGDRSFGGSWR